MVIKSFFEGMREELWGLKKDEPNTYGDAKFADWRELNEAGHIGGNGFRLGFVDGKPVTCQHDASVLAIAKKGYGKSLTMGASIRQERAADLLIVDASGSMYDRHKGELEGNGYKVRCINLVNPTRGETYNPLSFFKASNRQFGLSRDVQTFGHLAVQSEHDGKHWVDIARILFNALVLAEAKYGPILGSIGKIAEMLSASSYEQIAAYFYKLKKYNDPKINTAISAFEKVEAKERGSFFSTMTRKFEPWFDDALEYLANGTSWSWEQLFEAPQKQAVFLITGLEHQEVIAPYTRLMVGLAVASAGRWYSAHEEMPLPKGLKVYVDEGDLLGDCQPVADAITKQRKVGVNVWLAYQSLSQLNKNMVDAKSILENSDLWLTGGLNDDELLKRVSFLIGQRTITTSTKNENGDTEREEGQALITADQIRSLSIDEFIGLVGTRKVRGEKAYRVESGGVRFR